MYYVVIMQDSKTSDTKADGSRFYDKAVDIVHEYFLSCNLIVKDGKPFDPACTNDEEGFKAIEGTMYNGKVASFVHRGGDGPMGKIQEGLGPIGPIGRNIIST